MKCNSCRKEFEGSSEDYAIGLCKECQDKMDKEIIQKEIYNLKYRMSILESKMKILNEMVKNDKKK